MDKTDVKDQQHKTIKKTVKDNGDDNSDNDDEDGSKEVERIKKSDSTPMDEEVKSAAIVKYSAVEVPASFTRLRCNTDLNLPPSNWLSNSVETYGLRPSSFFHRSGFSSFRMAHMFPDCVGEVDVVSDAENVKKLLKIPYSHGPVSMMIHRIENTLLIDEFDVHKYLLREAECQWEWFKKFFIENVMQSANPKDKVICHRDNSRNALQQKSLVSKFLYHSLVVADPHKSSMGKPRNNHESTDESVHLPLTYKNNPPLPDPSLEEESPDPGSNHKFARNVVWTFEDIQMLLGTDMPIFGGGTHPCISLRLRDMTKPINVLTGMDYWLDNLMCNVPEVIMCYHLNGIVQKYELIKTEDLPHLENSKFSPKVIRDIAQNILSFLKANATKAGHTYWLFKGKDDDVVKLYDLTSLCTDVMDEKGQTPFTVPVAMLLYRVARNMKNSSDGRRQAATIRMLLKNCLSLLSQEKYPEIVTSTHYMLADLYIPADINPASPELYSDDDSQAPDANDIHRMPNSEKNTAIKSMSLANISEVNMDEAEFISPAPPIGMDVKARCIDGLGHVFQGLKSLKFLEEKKENHAGNDVTEPKMAKPFQTIPMPYQSLNEDKEDETMLGKKRVKKKKKPGDENPKNLLCKIKSDTIPSWKPPPPQNTTSWKVHLKSLLYEKMCLIYATLMEKTYSDKNFGLTLRYIKMVLIARKLLKSLRTDMKKNDVESYLLGRAGDALFMIVQNCLEMEKFEKEYTSMSDVDLETADELKSDIFKDFSEETDFPTKLKNLEDLLLKSSLCYQKALAMGDSLDNENLLRRLGNIENELGVFYMNQAAAKYQDEVNSQKTEVESSVYKELFIKSQEHLQNGIKAFAAIKDEANLALLYSNTGRLMRVQAHFLSVSDTDGSDLATQEKNFYKKSIFNYQKALQVLGDRKYNPGIWDSVHWELSTALFAMATLLQDYPCFRNKEEAEKEVTETLHKALKYCDVDTPGSRQPVYQFRSAMIHHRLASLYHKSYRTLTEDETKRKKAYQLCRLHYEKSTKLLLQLENSSEYLRVQLERVALSEFQAECATSSSSKVKHYECALELLIEAIPILKVISDRELKFYDSSDEKLSDQREKRINREGENEKEKEELSETKTELENECTLLDIFEQRLQFILLSLTKLCMSRNESKKGLVNGSDLYKKLYGITLRSESSKKDPIALAKSLLDVVGSISEKLESALQ